MEDARTGAAQEKMKIFGLAEKAELVAVVGRSRRRGRRAVLYLVTKNENAPKKIHVTVMSQSTP
jgi:hypothetical protein